MHLHQVKGQDYCAWEFIVCLRRWLPTTLAKSSMQKVQIIFDLQPYRPPQTPTTCFESLANRSKQWHWGVAQWPKLESTRQGAFAILSVNWTFKKEANLVNLQMRLMANQKPKRIQRKQYRELQSELMGQWEDYASNRKSVLQLLNRCVLLAIRV